jgi:hypothetical protein
MRLREITLNVQPYNAGTDRNAPPHAAWTNGAPYLSENQFWNQFTMDFKLHELQMYADLRMVCVLLFMS